MNAFVRPWDADAANFVLIAKRIEIQAPLMWQILQIFGYDCNLNLIEHTVTAAADHFIRPWDASTANFVLISAKLGMHATLIAQTLQLHRCSCSIELVEETLVNAGFMAWVPTPPGRLIMEY